MIYEDEVTKRIAQTPEEEMLRRTPWLKELHKDHPERAQRMIDDHWNRIEGSSPVSTTQARIEVILLKHLREPPTTMEEWAKIKAEQIIKMLKEE